jgi:hydroxyacylglutathione hydrolase
MLLKRFYDAKLAQASYLMACRRTGEGLVVDPNRDVDQYMDAAVAEGVRVTHVTETHIHADFVSGSRELAARAGARLLLSNEGGDDWRYGYAASAGATLLADGDCFTVGDVRIDVLHTPGHTPEHLSFLVTDAATSDRPVGVLTGDFVFVSDVGRPDLLERAAKIEGTMEAGARALFRSLERFRALPDYVQVWPGHGAGSACGKALGAMPFSTVGYERYANWGVATEDESEFVMRVLEGQPEPPTYFARMKQVNRDGPPGERPARPTRLALSDLDRALTRGDVVVDARSTDAFAAGHVPGTLNVPLNKSFSTWMGWLVPYDHPFFLIVGGRADAETAARDLAMIGLDDLAGYFDAGVVAEWRETGRSLTTVPEASLAEVAEALEQRDAVVIDVRGEAEWAAGHLPGARHIPLGHLAGRIAEIPRERRVLVHCQGAARSATAASLLQASGHERVATVPAGFSGWTREGRPVERRD